MKKVLLCVAVLGVLIGAMAGCHHEVEPAHEAGFVVISE